MNHDRALSLPFSNPRMIFPTDSQILPPLPCLAFSPRSEAPSGTLLDGYIFSRRIREPFPYVHCSSSSRAEESLNSGGCNSLPFVRILVGTRGAMDEWLRLSGPGSSAIWAQAHDCLDSRKRSLTGELKLAYRLRTDFGSFIPILKDNLLELMPHAASFGTKSLDTIFSNGEDAAPSSRSADHNHIPTAGSESGKIVDLILPYNPYVELSKMVSVGGILHQFQVILLQMVGCRNFLDVDYHLLDFPRWLRIHNFASFSKETDVLIVRSESNEIKWTLFRFDFVEGLINFAQSTNWEILESTFGSNKMSWTGDPLFSSEITSDDTVAAVDWKVWSIEVQPLTQFLFKDFNNCGTKLKLGYTVEEAEVLRQKNPLAGGTSVKGWGARDSGSVVQKQASLTSSERCALSDLRSKAHNVRQRGFLFFSGWLSNHTIDASLNISMDRSNFDWNTKFSRSKLCAPVVSPVTSLIDEIAKSGDGAKDIADESCETETSSVQRININGYAKDIHMASSTIHKDELGEELGAATHQEKKLDFTAELDASISNMFMDTETDIRVGWLRLLFWLENGFVEALIHSITIGPDHKSLSEQEFAEVWEVDVQETAKLCLKVLDVIPGEGSQRLIQTLVQCLRCGANNIMRLNKTTLKKEHCSNMNRSLSSKFGHESVRVIGVAEEGHHSHLQQEVQQCLQKMRHLCKVMSLIVCGSSIVAGLWAEAGGLDFILELYSYFVESFPTNLRIGLKSSSVDEHLSPEGFLPGETTRASEFSVFPCIPLGTIVSQACGMNSSGIFRKAKVESPRIMEKTFGCPHKRCPFDCDFSPRRLCNCEKYIEGLFINDSPSTSTLIYESAKEDLSLVLEEQIHDDSDVPSDTGHNYKSGRLCLNLKNQSTRASNQNNDQPEDTKYTANIEDISPQVPRPKLHSVTVSSTNTTSPTNEEDIKQATADVHTCMTESWTETLKLAASSSSFNIFILLSNLKSEFLQTIVSILSSCSLSVVALKKKLKQRLKDTGQSQLVLQFIPDLIGSFHNVVPEYNSTRIKKLALQVILILDGSDNMDVLKMTENVDDSRNTKEPDEPWLRGPEAPPHHESCKTFCDFLIEEVGERMEILLKSLPPGVLNLFPRRVDLESPKNTSGKTEEFDLCDPLLADTTISSRCVLSTWADIGLLLRALSDIVDLLPESRFSGSIMKICGDHIEGVLSLLSGLKSPQSWSIAQILVMQQLLKLFTASMSVISVGAPESQTWDDVDAFFWRTLTERDSHWNCIQNYTRLILVTVCERCLGNLLKNYCEVLWELLEFYYSKPGHNLIYGRLAKNEACCLQGKQISKKVVLSFLRSFVSLVQKRLLVEGEKTGNNLGILGKCMYMLQFLLNPVDGLLLHIIQQALSDVNPTQMHLIGEHLEDVEDLMGVRKKHSTDFITSAEHLGERVVREPTTTSHCPTTISSASGISCSSYCDHLDDAHTGEVAGQTGSEWHSSLEQLIDVPKTTECAKHHPHCQAPLPVLHERRSIIPCKLSAAKPFIPFTHTTEPNYFYSIPRKGPPGICKRCTNLEPAKSSGHETFEHDSLCLLEDILKLKASKTSVSISMNIRAGNPFLPSTFAVHFLETLFLCFLKNYNTKIESHDHSQSGMPPSSQEHAILFGGHHSTAGYQTPTCTYFPQQFSTRDEFDRLCLACCLDEQLSAACLMYGRVLLMLAQNQTDDISRKFQQMRIMDFLVDQIALEYQTSKIVTPREDVLIGKVTKSREETNVFDSLDGSEFHAINARREHEQDRISCIVNNEFPVDTSIGKGSKVETSNHIVQVHICQNSMDLNNNNKQEETTKDSSSTSLSSSSNSTPLVTQSKVTMTNKLNNESSPQSFIICTSLPIHCQKQKFAQDMLLKSCHKLPHGNFGFHSARDVRMFRSRFQMDLLNNVASFESPFSNCHEFMLKWQEMMNFREQNVPKLTLPFRVRDENIMSEKQSFSERGTTSTRASVQQERGADGKLTRRHIPREQDENDIESNSAFCIMNNNPDVLTAFNEEGTPVQQPADNMTKTNLSVLPLKSELYYSGRFVDLNEEVERELEEEELKICQIQTVYKEEEIKDSVEKTPEVTIIYQETTQHKFTQDITPIWDEITNGGLCCARPGKVQHLGSTSVDSLNATKMRPAIPKLKLPKSVWKERLDSNSLDDFAVTKNFQSHASTAEVAITAMKDKHNSLVERWREDHLYQEGDIEKKFRASGLSNISACLKRRIYSDAGLHILLLELFISLMITPRGTLEACYSDRFPMENRKLNVPFFLSYHLNHARNLHLLPFLSKKIKEYQPAAFRILKLTWRALFNPTIYTNRVRIAHGAFAQVYSSTVKRDGIESEEQVVLKVVDVPKGPHDPCKFFDVYSEVEILERFMGEPRVCQILDYGVDTESFILVLKQYKCSLRTWRLQHNGYSQSEASAHVEINKVWVAQRSFYDCLPLYLEVYCAVLNAVKALENQKIVHYDLKCDNILLEPIESICSEADFWDPIWPPKDTSCALPFRICIADFGQSKESVYCGGECTTRSRGTEYVRSPEMLKRLGNCSSRGAKISAMPSDEHVGKAVDVWGLGCLLYELLTGEYLLYDQDWLRFFIRVTLPSEELITNEKAAKLHNYAPVMDLLRFVLVRDPVQRPTLDEVASCLQELMLKLKGNASGTGDVELNFKSRTSEHDSNSAELSERCQDFSVEEFSATIDLPTEQSTASGSSWLSCFYHVLCCPRQCSDSTA